MRNNISPELLQKYMDDQCTPEEISAVQSWYAQFDAESDPLDTYSPGEQAQLKKQMLDQLKQKIQGAASVKRKKPVRKLLYWTAAAAVLVLTLKLFIAGPEASKFKTPLAELEISNQGKTILKQVLPDGSQVWLSPSAKLTYPKSFRGLAFRTVKMQGQAFFEVVKDHAHPFIIHSGAMTTRVWGTSFQVRALPGQEWAEVKVLTGKVSVESSLAATEKKTAEVMLQPNQQASFNTRSHVLKKQEKAEMSALQIWKKVSLSFNNTPVKEVIEVLNKEFKVQISTRDKQIDSFVLKADFTGQNFPDIMEMIKKSLDLNYQVSDDKVLLSLNTK